MSGENNITQTYNKDKQLMLPKSVYFLSEDDLLVDFDTSFSGNTFIAKGNYTEDFIVS